MGAYVNPDKESKESFLQREGKEGWLLDFNDKPEGTLPVVLCDNGPFTAAGICYSSDEFKAFTDSLDNRPKLMFTVAVDKLHEVSPELKDYMR